MSEQLYELLSDGDGIPWNKRAEQFIMLKVASGGLPPGELEDYVALCKQAAEVHPPASPDKGELADAARKGLINAVRSGVASDIAQVRKTERTRGARVGKEVGTAAGALAGILAGKKHGVAGAATGGALGALLGRGAGKVTGEEIDRARIEKSFKKGSMEKTTGFGDEDTPKLAEAKQEKDRKSGKIVGTAAGIGAVAGGVAEPVHAAYSHGKYLKSPKFEADVNKQFSGIFDQAWEQSAGRGAPSELKEAVRSAARSDPGTMNKIRNVVKAHTRPRYALRTLGGAAGGAVLGTAAGAIVDKVRRMIKHKKEEHAKTAGIAAPPTGPGPDEMLAEKLQQQQMVPDQAAEQQVAGENALGEFLNMQQIANEAEFFRQMAEEAKSQAEMASSENQNLQQQVGMLQQQTQQAQMGAQQESMMAQQTAQQATQDAMMARNESMAAQQAHIALRSAVTNYRQALMDLLAQDPTQAVPPPMAPQGPMAPGPGAAGPPPAGAPAGPEAGPPAAGPAGPAPGSEMGGAPPAAPEMPALPTLPQAGGPPMGAGAPPPAEPPAPAKPKSEKKPESKKE